MSDASPEFSVIDRRRTSKRRRKLALVGIGVALMALVLVLVLRSQSDSLLSHATKVMNDKGAAFLYFWLSEHELITVCSSGSGLCCYDLLKKAETPLESLPQSEQLVVAAKMQNQTTASDISEQWGYWNRHRNTAPPHPLSVAPPSGADIQEVVESPGGDRIAWLLQYKYVPPLPTLLHKIFPGYKTQRQDIKRLWLSRYDGSQMREVGSVSVFRKPDYGTEPNGLHWTSDGKGLSFVYKDALWIVPAD